MAGVLDNFLGRMRTATAGGGILSGLTSGGGILATAVGPLQSRLASMQAAGTPQAKIQALTGTLGMRLKAPGGLLAGIGKGISSPGGPPPPATSTSYQVSSSGRVYGSPAAPEGIVYR